MRSLLSNRRRAMIRSWDPTMHRQTNGSNDDEVWIDARIGRSAICNVARVSFVQCQALRPLPQRCGRDLCGGDPPPRSAAFWTGGCDDRDSKFENAWSESVHDRARATSPRALIVCDLSVRARSILDAVPTCFIDHHYFSDPSLDGVVITGFQVEPCPPG
jgi:hypothetical protein